MAITKADLSGLVANFPGRVTINGRKWITICLQGIPKVYGERTDSELFGWVTNTKFLVRGTDYWVADGEVYLTIHAALVVAVRIDTPEALAMYQGLVMARDRLEGLAPDGYRAKYYDLKNQLNELVEKLEAMKVRGKL